MNLAFHAQQLALPVGLYQIPDMIKAVPIKTTSSMVILFARLFFAVLIGFCEVNLNKKSTDFLIMQKLTFFKLGFASDFQIDYFS